MEMAHAAGHLVDRMKLFSQLRILGATLCCRINGQTTSFQAVVLLLSNWKLVRTLLIRAPFLLLYRAMNSSFSDPSSMQDLSLELYIWQLSTFA